VAEEIAVIIPIHENTIDDATTGVLDEITKEGGAAIGRKLDGAVLFGTDKPASWTSDDLLAAAVARARPSPSATSPTVTTSPARSSRPPARRRGRLGALGPARTPRPAVPARQHPQRRRHTRSSCRHSRTAVGTVDNREPASTPHWVSGLVWDRDDAEAMVVDAMRVIIGVRQDITVKFLDQATVGGINLAERDMVALRFKARYAYVLGNTRTDEGATKCPVAAVLPNPS
jgi:hypothetical protein